MADLSFFSLVTAPVHVISASGIVLSKATCFFYKQDAKWSYLVTNWHVVTGRDPLRPQNSRTGAVPARLRLLLHANVGAKTINSIRKIPFEIEINDSTGDMPTWSEHPTHKYKVDLVVMKIENDEKFKGDVTCSYLSEYPDFQNDFFPSVMDNAFVIGYPWGLTGGDPVLPLYKRGSVASEPIVDFGSLPRFLIDCRSSEAMSGSPVLCTSSGLWAPNGVTFSSVVGTVENFAGVYSGRLKAVDVSPEKNADLKLGSSGRKVHWTRFWTAVCRVPNLVSFGKVMVRER
jgi:hypothetical protein